MMRKLTILFAGAVLFNITNASAQDVTAIRNAAEQGNATAQFDLGMMYENGRGVPRDDAQAVVWFRKAAEQGLDAARAKLESKKAQDRGSSIIGLPSWVQSYSESNKSCTSWTDDCVTCKRDAGAELACSNIGIACQPNDVRCLDSIKTTAPK
jgi:TPR repeat protein